MFNEQSPDKTTQTLASSATTPNVDLEARLISTAGGTDLKKSIRIDDEELGGDDQDYDDDMLNMGFDGSQLKFNDDDDNLLALDDDDQLAGDSLLLFDKMANDSSRLGDSRIIHESETNDNQQYAGGDYLQSDRSSEYQ